MTATVNKPFQPTLDPIGEKIISQIDPKRMATLRKRAFWCDYFKFTKPELVRLVKTIYWPKEIDDNTRVRMSEVLFSLEQQYEYSAATVSRAIAYRQVRKYAI